MNAIHICCKCKRVSTEGSEFLFYRTKEYCHDCLVKNMGKEKEIKAQIFFYDFHSDKEDDKEIWYLSVYEEGIKQAGEIALKISRSAQIPFKIPYMFKIRNMTFYLITYYGSSHLHTPYIPGIDAIRVVHKTKKTKKCTKDYVLSEIRDYLKKGLYKGAC
jgi:hypothetical protein